MMSGEDVSQENVEKQKVPGVLLRSVEDQKAHCVSLENDDNQEDVNIQEFPDADLEEDDPQENPESVTMLKVPKMSQENPEGPWCVYGDVNNQEDPGLYKKDDEILKKSLIYIR